MVSGGRGGVETGGASARRGLRGWVCGVPVFGCVVGGGGGGGVSRPRSALPPDRATAWLAGGRGGDPRSRCRPRRRRRRRRPSCGGAWRLVAWRSSTVRHPPPHAPRLWQGRGGAAAARGVGPVDQWARGRGRGGQRPRWRGVGGGGVGCCAVLVRGVLPVSPPSALHPPHACASPAPPRRGGTLPPPARRCRWRPSPGEERGAWRRADVARGGGGVAPRRRPTAGGGGGGGVRGGCPPRRQPRPIWRSPAAALCAAGGGVHPR